MIAEPTSLLSRAKKTLSKHFSTNDDWRRFQQRLNVHFDVLHDSLHDLYGERADFPACVESILHSAAAAYNSRSTALKLQDEKQDSNNHWYLDNTAIGAVCYVDLFAENLQGLRDRLPYFQELGISYLHLMPLFKAPEDHNDGGYAVSDYRHVNPALGDMVQLTEIISTFRDHGIRIVLDFIYNHTSDEHEWAKRARQNEQQFQDFYYFFPDREMPDQYEQTLREVFPEDAPGNFSYIADLDQWVWTTFKTYQWDLNYSNPAVFKAMGEEMLFLANCGVDTLRLDAVAFAWKEMGTPCESLDKVLSLVTAFNQLARIAAPSLLFKSEAIVHPDEVARYIGPRKCQISYNPLLMALLWESLATREVKLLQHSMAKRFRIHTDTAWVNYIRGHDDVGWTFCDDDAAEVGIRGHDHRHFLNQFYTGQHPGSFASGVAFEPNLATGDCRVCGTAASLAGLERAVRESDDDAQDKSIARLLLLHSIILSIGGIPLIYLGDELATLNDYSYENDPHKSSDARWVNRPRLTESDLMERAQPGTPANALFSQLRELIHLRKSTPVFAGQDTEIIHSRHRHIFVYLRRHAGESLLVLCNFSEFPQALGPDITQSLFGDKALIDLIKAETIQPGVDVSFQPYQFRWLRVG